MAQVKRQIARLVRISTLLNGEYVKQEGWEPNYVLTQSNQRISRANIMAIVISQPSSLEVEVDDGSAKITLRQFDEQVELMKLTIGDPVLIIGRPREFERSMYIIPEVVKKLKNTEWLKVRQQRVPAEQLAPPMRKEELVEPQKSESHSFRESYEKIYSLIKNLDDGKGADTEAVLLSANLKQGDDIIKQLIMEGEVFELTPGKLKVLE